MRRKVAERIDRQEIDPGGRAEGRPPRGTRMAGPNSWARRRSPSNSCPFRAPRRAPRPAARSDALSCGATSGRVDAEYPLCRRSRRPGASPSASQSDRAARAPPRQRLEFGASPVTASMARRGPPRRDRRPAAIRRAHQRPDPRRSCRPSPAPCGISDRRSFRAVGDRLPYWSPHPWETPRSTPCPDLSSLAPTRTRAGAGRAGGSADVRRAWAPHPAAPCPVATATRSRKKGSWLRCTVVFCEQLAGAALLAPAQPVRQTAMTDFARRILNGAAVGAHLQLESAERRGGGQARAPRATAGPGGQQRQTSRAAADSCASAGTSGGITLLTARARRLRSTGRDHR